MVIFSDEHLTVNYQITRVTKDYCSNVCEGQKSAGLPT